MEDYDLRFIRVAIDIAQRARNKGNHPFGALLVDNQGHILLKAENPIVTEKDCTGHAETNFMWQASKEYDRDFLAHCSIYTSTEPCPMCSGAIFWGNVRRVVYGLSEASFYDMVGKDTVEVLFLPCWDLFVTGLKPIEVIGQVLEEQAKQVHVDFW